MSKSRRNAKTMADKEKRQDSPVFRNPEEWEECEICGIAVKTLKHYGEGRVCLDCHRTIVDPCDVFVAEDEEE